MAILDFDGFDDYNGTGANTGIQAKWTGGGGSLVSGRFGGQAYACTANGINNRSITKTFTADSSVGVGFAIRWTTLPSADSLGWFVAFLSGSTYTFAMRLKTDGTLDVYRATSDSAGVLLGSSSAGQISINTWYYMEIGLVVNDSTGSVVVKLNNSTIINLTNVDTNNGVTTVNAIRLGFTANAFSNQGTVNIDDYYLVDTNTTLGEAKVEQLVPTSDVAQGFARSSGSTNYTLVDEAQVNGDTDYVQGSTVSDTDTYGMGNLSSTPVTIHAVMISAFALKTDAGSRSIALQAKSGGTTSDGSNYSLGTSYGKFERILETDPNTSVAWTGSGIDALQCGPKVTV